MFGQALFFCFLNSGLKETGQKNLFHFVLKPARQKPIARATCLHMFSEFWENYMFMFWLITVLVQLSVPFVIGQGDYFGLGFTVLF